MVAVASSAAYVVGGAALAVGGVRLAYLTAVLWRSRRPALTVHRLGPLALSLLGMAAAALLHSSSAVCLVALSWVQSGLLTTAQGLAVVLGANVGTTATAQTVSFALDASIGSALGVVALLSWAWGRSRRAAPVLLGFAAIVIGVELFSLGVVQLAQGLLQGLAVGRPRPGGVAFAFLTGWLVTSVLQSSTLVTSTVVALAGRHLIQPAAAVALVLGSNTGTVTTALLASLMLGGKARRLALLDLLTNLLPGLALAVAAEAFAGLLQRWDPRPERVAANAHTLFNLATWALFLPWVNPLGRWVERG